MPIQPRLDEIIRFLSDTDSYEPPAGKVTVLQTHISVVVITERLVYKLKKAVLFDFLDFSTLEKRLFFCEEEVRLNQRLSKDLYLAILPIYQIGQKLSFHPDGEVVDYVIKMRRLSEEHLLINRIKSPDFPLFQLDLLAERLLDFYRNAPSGSEVSVFGGIESLTTTMQEITADFTDYIGHTLTPTAAHWIKTFLFHFINAHQSLFKGRVQSRKIIEGHGDLRSEHIHIEHNTVTIYDCIEFSQRLRCLDWLNDLAFLLMDLEYRRCYSMATQLQLKLVTEVEKGEVTGLLTFYKTYRACVRGKVDTLKFKEEEVPSMIREESRLKAARYFQLACRYAVLGTEPIFLVCMGGGGTGKTTMAKALGEEWGLTVFSSDVVRKQRAGIDLYERLPDDERKQLYNPKTSDEVYRELTDRGLTEVQNAGAVILDATYRNEKHLQQLQSICRQRKIRLVVIQTVAPEEIIKERLKKRDTEPTVSDLRSVDYNPERFDVLYSIDKYTEYAFRVKTGRAMEELINDELFPQLVQLQTRVKAVKFAN